MEFSKTAPDGFKVMRNLQQHVEQSSLEHSLMEPAKMRASQINGRNRLAIPFRAKVGDY